MRKVQPQPKPQFKTKRTRPEAGLGPIDVQQIVKTVSKNLVGQDAFVKECEKVLKRAAAGLYDPTRPLASYVLVGPTGVGKTYAVETLARALHPDLTGQNSPMLIVECGALGQDHEVARLVGAPPGYIGHRETIPVFSSVKIRAKTTAIKIPVILFDEIEKAAPSLQRVLLSILERGALQMGDNTEVSFANSLIFFTSNLGAREYEKTLKPIGFYYQKSPKINVFNRAIEKHFLPELRGRLSGIIPFFPLSKDDLLKVANLEILKINVNLKKNNQPFDVWFKKDYLHEIIADGEDIMAYNVRAVKHRIENIVYQISDHLLSPEEEAERGTYTISIGKDGIKVK